MPRGVSPKTKDIRNYILVCLSMYPEDVLKLTQEKFDVTRQTVHRHLKTLIDAGDVIAKGKTKSRKYSLATKSEFEYTLDINSNSEEDKIWRDKVRPLIKDLQQNVIDICHHGVTEMINNVIDHSESNILILRIKQTAITVHVDIKDMGVGIFEKIQKDFGLSDPRQALLELSKGKLTSDANNHSGEGIFFTSKMFDRFFIRSGKMLYACYTDEDHNLFFESLDKKYIAGTDVAMIINKQSARTDTEVFTQYTDSEDFSFSKTHVPVFLAHYDHDQLVSRSAAKRLLKRFDKFKEVWLDFRGVEKIGQAFADEIFRVYATANPGTELRYSKANKQVTSMIKRAIGKNN